MTNSSYQQRFARLFAYIDQHLDERLDIETLSQVACWSKYHFHRQFSQLFGISVAKYIQLQRLKRASYQLSFRQHYTITDIALNAGFENPESFTRAFKKTFGQNPSQFKQQPQWADWQQTLKAMDQAINTQKEHIMHQQDQQSIKVVNFPTTKLAVLEHHGNPNEIFNSVKKFISWRKAYGLSPKVSQTYNLLYDDPNTIAAEQFQLDICATTPTDIPPNEEGIINKTIPAGRCAVLRHIGSDQNFHKSFAQLFSWLEQNNETLRDFPCFIHRVVLYPDVNEPDMISDIYLPLE